MNLAIEADDAEDGTARTDDLRSFVRPYPRRFPALVQFIVKQYRDMLRLADPAS